MPIVIDGFISGAAAVAAMKIHPGARDFMFSSHASAEAGISAVSGALGLYPMLALDMRLGEGTGCALAFHIIEAAVKIVNEMGTFKDIGMCAFQRILRYSISPFDSSSFDEKRQ